MENVQEYFTSTDDNRTVTFKQRMDGSGWSSVKALCKSSENSSIRLKFTMANNNVWFGICNENFKIGKIGTYDIDSWGWRCNNSEAHHGVSPSTPLRLHALGDMTGKEVIMEYDGRNKRLVVTCEGNDWTHTDPTFPTEGFFVFSLSHPTHKVSIHPN